VDKKSDCCRRFSVVLLHNILNPNKATKNNFIVDKYDVQFPRDTKNMIFEIFCKYSSIFCFRGDVLAHYL